MKEALDRKADVKQGRLASEAMGRVNGAVKTKLDYRLNKLKLIEIEAKVIEDQKPQNEKAQPKQIRGKAAA